MADFYCQGNNTLFPLQPGFLEFCICGNLLYNYFIHVNLCFHVCFLAMCICHHRNQFLQLLPSWQPDSICMITSFTTAVFTLHLMEHLQWIRDRSFYVWCPHPYSQCPFHLPSSLRYGLEKKRRVCPTQQPFHCEWQCCNGGGRPWPWAPSLIIAICNIWHCIQQLKNNPRIPVTSQGLPQKGYPSKHWRIFWGSFCFF